jgi:hypothetical protein
MAIPPEPVAELVSLATLIVDATVARVLTDGEKPPRVSAPPGYTGVEQKLASQVVVLKVHRTLKGELPTAAAEHRELTVTKPIAAYALRAGNKGGFFLQQQNAGIVIIGRYGPDTHRLQSIEKALGSSGSQAPKK